MAEVLRPNRPTPILPEKVHKVPLTIGKLAEAIYYIGRSALSGQELAPDQMKATLAMIAVAAQGALEG
jgi:hypothetical protein